MSEKSLKVSGVVSFTVGPRPQPIGNVDVDLTFGSGLRLAVKLNVAPDAAPSINDPHVDDLDIHAEVHKHPVRAVDQHVDHVTGAASRGGDAMDQRQFDCDRQSYRWQRVGEAVDRVVARLKPAGKAAQ